jgi:hypothetical protein
MEHQVLKSLPIGYFGNNEGVVIALHAAALLNKNIKAVVGAGGQPELAKNALNKIKASLLLIAGEKNNHSVYMHQIAYDQLKDKRKLVIIEDVFSFKGTGTWKKVADLTAGWMDEHLVWPVMTTTGTDLLTGAANTEEKRIPEDFQRF